MRIQPELNHKIRREIRDARVKDPLISVVALQEQLERQFSRTFSRKYIAKLAVKVERQALADADRTKIAERMQFTRENYRIARERLLKIIYWGRQEHRHDGFGDPERRGRRRHVPEADRGAGEGDPLRALAGRGAGDHHRGVVAWRIAAEGRY
jgi:hypothetical protein